MAVELVDSTLILSTSDDSVSDAYTSDSHTLDGDTTCIVLAVSIMGNGTVPGPDMSAITASFGGETMTLAEYGPTNGFVSQANMAVFVLAANLPSGSQTATVTMGGSPGSEQRACEMVLAEYKGVNTADPIGQTNEAVSATTVAITPDNDDSAIAVLCSSRDGDNGPWTPNSDTTELHDSQTGSSDYSNVATFYGHHLNAEGSTEVTLGATPSSTVTERGVIVVELNPGAAPGERYVRRQNASRSSTSNTTAADITYDTEEIAEGGFSYSSPEVTVPETRPYLVIWDIGQVDLASTRAVGTLVPSINSTDQTRFRATHRYLRNSGGSQEGASIGMGIFQLTAGDDIKVRNPGVLTPTDAINNYATNTGYGGGFQVIALPDGNFTHVERTVDAAEVGTSNINTTRPWLDSSGTWTKITYNSEVQDDDSLYSGSGGDVTLKAGKKYLIPWGSTIYSTDASRHTDVVALNIDGTRVQTGSGYQRNTASQGPPICGMYLHEVGGSDETIYLEATHEIEGGDAGTPNVSDAYLQVIELPDSAEWIHVDNGTTDSLTTALAGLTTWYDTPLSSTFRADGDSNLSLDSGNDAVQNDSGGTLPILAIGWHRWDRDELTSGTRKAPWTRWDNGGSAVGYGVASAYSRGQQSTDDTWQAHYCSVATMDLADGADLSFQVQDEASGSNADMGVYASTSRYFLGVQVLNLNTLVDAGAASSTLDASAGSISLVGSAADFLRSKILPANTGSLAITGQAADLLKSHLLDAETGSLSLAGQAADLLRDLLLEAETGNFTLLGQSAELVEAFLLNAESGSYALSGQDLATILLILLQAETGSFTLSGQAADLLRSLIVDAETGSLTLAGQDASFAVNALFELEAGSFGLIGAAADLQRHLQLEAEAGAFSLTGQPASLLASIVLDAETGAFSLSGQSADLIEGLILEAGTGSFTLSGGDVTFSTELVLNAETGSYSLAGSAADLARALLLNAESGSLDLTGQAAELATSYIIEMDAGAFTLTGSASNLHRQLILNTETGGFTLTGLAATFISTSIFEVDSGSFTLAGSAADLKRELLLLASSGDLSLQGQAAAFYLTEILNAESGTYSLSGADANLLRSLILQAESGSFTLIGLSVDLPIEVVIAASFQIIGAPYPAIELTGAPCHIEAIIGAPSSEIELTGAPSHIDAISGAPYPELEIVGAP